jgi:hypothetical protein
MANGNDNGSGKVYGTLADIQATKPPKDKWAIWTVMVAGKPTRWTWADSMSHALKIVAMVDGYSARQHNSKPVSKESVGTMLASLSDEDRAALIMQYVTAPTNGQAATPPAAAPAVPQAAPGKKGGR